jgi:hypothetical protein
MIMHYRTLLTGLLTGLQASQGRRPGCGIA